MILFVQRMSTFVSLPKERKWNNIRWSVESGFLKYFMFLCIPKKDIKQWGFNLNLSVHLLLRTTNNPSASVFNFVSLLILRIIVALTGLNASLCTGSNAQKPKVGLDGMGISEPLLWAPREDNNVEKKRHWEWVQISDCRWGMRTWKVVSREETGPGTGETVLSVNQVDHSLCVGSAQENSWKSEIAQ